MKTQIAIEYVRWMQSERQRINKMKLSDIEWTENAEVLNIPQQTIDDFEICGLNNIDFINSCYYQKGKKQLSQSHRNREC